MKIYLVWTDYTCDDGAYVRSAYDDERRALAASDYLKGIDEDGYPVDSWVSETELL